jgi:hypothetical protein
VRWADAPSCELSIFCGDVPEFAQEVTKWRCIGDVEFDMAGTRGRIVTQERNSTCCALHVPATTPNILVTQQTRRIRSVFDVVAWLQRIAMKLSCTGVRRLNKDDDLNTMDPRPSHATRNFQLFNHHCLQAVEEASVSGAGVHVHSISQQCLRGCHVKRVRHRITALSLAPGLHIYLFPGLSNSFQVSVKSSPAHHIVRVHTQSCDMDLAQKR